MENGRMVCYVWVGRLAFCGHRKIGRVWLDTIGTAFLLTLKFIRIPTYLRYAQVEASNQSTADMESMTKG
jgi:hypothetical protein